MQPANETDTSTFYSWLVLSHFSSVSAKDWVIFFDQNQLTPSMFLELSSEDWMGLGVAQKVIERRSRAERAANSALEFINQCNKTSVITYTSEYYPARLAALAHPPCTLFVQGQIANLNALQIAMVGSRHASINGKRTTEMLARDLAAHGIAVTSGLAKGIDTSAHRGALQHKNGKTVAVLGCGIDICYPKYNQPLFDEIIDRSGSIVSEFLPGTPPRPHHFPQRNRIVAALTEGVVVVEAKIRSGSLITCNLAADLGKEVFAVPGNINHPLSEGGNWLIQQGAKLITCAYDVLEELKLVVQPTLLTENAKKHLASDPILDSVDYDVTHLNDIIKRSKLSSNDVLTALLEYELRGLIAAVPGGYLKLRGK